MQTFNRGRATCKLLSEILSGWPHEVLYFGGGLGDTLLCSALIHELTSRDVERTWMITQTPSLLRGTKAVRVLDIRSGVFRVLSIFGQRVKDLGYTERDWKNDRDVIPSEHIIAAMCRKSGIRGQVTLRPYLDLSEIELAAGKLAPDQIVMMSSGQSAKFAMLNKEWIPGRFQEVGERLHHRIIQVGDLRDPLIPQAIDMRGRLSVRETAAVIANSACFVGQVGFLMHLARSVDTPSVIVYGGRESPEQSGYTPNINFFQKLECSPCWRWNTCEFKRECMRRITVESVVDAVQRLVDQRLPRPLPADTCWIYDI